MFYYYDKFRFGNIFVFSFQAALDKVSKNHMLADVVAIIGKNVKT